MIHSRHMGRVLVLTLGSLLASIALAVAGGVPRTWTDSTGKFKIEARFVAQDKGKVTLEGKDGKRFEIEVTKLSAEDQKHLAELARKTSDDPFKAVGSAKSITPDWSGSRLVDLVAASPDWKVAAKPAVEVAFKAAPVALPARQNFFEGCNALVVNPLSRRALVGYQWTFSTPKANSRMLLCDLENGKVLSELKMDGLVTPLAIDDDGSRGLFKRTADKKDHLEIWSLAAAANEKTLEFIPTDPKGTALDIRWAVFLDKKRLLTASYDRGVVVLWELPSLRPIYHAMIQGASVPGLSHDRKLLAFTTGQQVGILDVDAGKVLAMRPATFTPWASLAFSPGGKWLACATNNRILVWDLTSGQQHREIFVNPTDVWGNIAWPNDKMMLVGGKSLLDLDLAYRFWEFKDQNQVQVFGTQGWFVTHDQKSGAVIPASVPSPAVLEAFEKAGPDIVLKPGAAVKLDVNSLPDEAERTKVAKALEEQLLKKGCKISADAPLELIASADLGKMIELNFVPATPGGNKGFKFGPKGKGTQPKLPPGTKVRTVKLQEHFARLKFVAQGKTVWESSADNVPKSVQLEEGETLEQRMQKLDRPNYAFYQTVDLPRLLHRDKGAGPLGTSQVSVSGVR
jgi:hypothetical protein